MKQFTFPVQIHSNQKTGHYLFDELGWPEEKTDDCEILIVGGGIAGLSAAAYLADKNIILCDLNKEPGGTASDWQHGVCGFATGAHYDLPYPEYFGRQVPEFLQSLGLMFFDTNQKIWHFKDQQFYIPAHQLERCYVNHMYQDDILTQSKSKRYFEKCMFEFEGTMVMPTSRTPAQHHSLNKITFADYLKQQKVSTALLNGINYKMRDDYGANADQISALAGIHYYACRSSDHLDSTFSPPEGNAYFSQHIAAAIPEFKIKKQHLVKHIQKSDKGYTATVIDIDQKIIKTINTRSVIYAGLKPALQKIYPAAYPLFEKNQYSAWMSIQFVMQNDFSVPAHWQNEILFDDISTPFLGFVDSAAQYNSDKAPRILTGYFCFAPHERQILMDIEQHIQRYLQDAVDLMNLYFAQDINNKIMEAHVFLHGHAMPIPAPHYLLNDRNTSLIAEQGFYFAGVDNGRLPLLYEAIDSGLQAADYARDFLHRKN